MGVRRNDVMALAQIATGLGIIAFWILFFTAGMAPAHPPTCFFAFEHAFTLPDAVLSIGLLAAGILQRMLRPEARSIRREMSTPQPTTAARSPRSRPCAPSCRQPRERGAE
jgi:hypothetical protein